MRYDAAIIPREKFSAAPATLGSLLRQPQQPSSIILFDVGYPQEIREEIGRLAAGGPPLRWIDYGEFQLANRCLDDLRELSESEWICILENDCSLRGGDIAKSIEHAQQGGYEVVQPRIMEADGRVHYDPPHSYVHIEDGRLVHAVIRTPRTGYPAVSGNRRTFHIEKHCFLVRSGTLRGLGPLEHFLVTRSHWDLSFRFADKKAPILFDPTIEVEFVRSLDCDIDREYFLWRWKRDKVVAANDYIKQKWQISSYKSSVEWFDEMIAESKGVSSGVQE